MYVQIVSLPLIQELICFKDTPFGWKRERGENYEANARVSFNVVNSSMSMGIK